MRLRSVPPRALLLLLAVWLAGCAAPMTDKQREGVELRRYCEQHPTDQVKCLGFLGFL